MRISTPNFFATVVTLAAAAQFAVQSVSAQNKSWWLDLEAGVEFDDNVAVEQNDDNRESGDIAAILELDTGYKLVDEKQRLGGLFSSVVHVNVVQQSVAASYFNAFFYNPRNSDDLT